MTPRQRTIGFIICLATLVLAVLDSNIVSAATVPIVRDLDPVHGVDRIPESKVPGGSTSEMGAGAVAAFVSSIDVVFLAAGAVMVLALVLATRLRLRLPSGGSYGPHGSGGPVDQRAVVPVGAEQ
jgi:hypothetical protein